MISMAWLWGNQRFCLFCQFGNRALFLPIWLAKSGKKPFLPLPNWQSRFPNDSAALASYKNHREFCNFSHYSRLKDKQGEANSLNESSSPIARMLLYAPIFGKIIVTFSKLLILLATVVLQYLCLMVLM